MRQVSDAQRRARLGVRHALAARVDGPVSAVEAMTCLHATEMANVYLSVVSRSDATRTQIAASLYEDRSLVRQLAMRRTVFVFPRALLPAVHGSAAARVATQVRERLGREVEGAGLTDDGPAWVGARVTEILTVLADGPRTTAELRAELPELDRRLGLSPGTSYGTSVAVASRLLTVTAASGVVVRGHNEGGWRTSRPRWTLAADWLGDPPTPTTTAEGYATLVGSWLRSFGPGTEDDLVWWLGATKVAVRRALGDLGAVQVGLEGATGWLLPDDLKDVGRPEPWAALLPPLDPTTMGWKRRGFYLGEHGPALFDRNGNAGATAWVDGRVVGGWHQAPDGEVVLHLLEDVGPSTMGLLDAEAARLTAWLDGDVVRSVYASPLARSFAALAGDV